MMAHIQEMCDSCTTTGLSALEFVFLRDLLGWSCVTYGELRSEVEKPRLPS